MMVGLGQSSWPSPDDSTKTLGEFVHTSLCTTDTRGIVKPMTKPASIPEDSVPKMVGLGQSSWPRPDDSTKTLGEFVYTSRCTTDSRGIVVPTTKPASIPVDSVPMVVGLQQSQWSTSR